MSRVRPYIPLLGFVLPTVVVGYGVVIPRSCIAGVNELSIGFGTTILAAVLTYFAGQRAVLPKGVCTKPPLRVRIARGINRQAASPSGWFGRVLGFLSPGGKLVLAFRPDGDDVPARFRDPTYRFPRVEVVTAALEHVALFVGAPMPTSARGIVLLTATRSS